MWAQRSTVCSTMFLSATTLSHSQPKWITQIISITPQLQSQLSRGGIYYRANSQFLWLMCWKQGKWASVRIWVTLKRAKLCWLEQIWVLPVCRGKYIPKWSNVQQIKENKTSNPHNFISRHTHSNVVRIPGNDYFSWHRGPNILIVCPIWVSWA